MRLKTENRKPALQASQRLLSASHGARRVTIGWDSPESLRELSDGRQLTCPACGALLVLHAGAVRAHHFAHRPGSACTLPQTEPETEQHRAGKLLIAQWLRQRLPNAEVTVEAYLPETAQRADLLVEARTSGGEARTIAMEYQCANLSAQEWRRRHRLYREAGIEDLWLLGGSRLRIDRSGKTALGDAARPIEAIHLLITEELERTLLADGAPLLFLDAVGEVLGAGVVARFRPAEFPPLPRTPGRLAAQPLLELAFPWHLLDWRSQVGLSAAPATVLPPGAMPTEPNAALTGEQLWLWLEQRYRVSAATLSPFFGAWLSGQQTILCEPRLWQAAVYYRFVHRQTGDRWWLPAVETWARAFLPLARPLPIAKLRGALRALQELFAAAGFLTLPVGNSRSNARVAADLDTLPSPPNREEALRIARYRRTLDR